MNAPDIMRAVVALPESHKAKLRSAIRESFGQQKVPPKPELTPEEQAAAKRKADDLAAAAAETERKRVAALDQQVNEIMRSLASPMMSDTRNGVLSVIAQEIGVA